MSSFKLSSEDSEFNNRVDALFNSLQTAAVDHEPQTQAKRTREEESPDEDADVDEHSGRIGHKFRRPAGIPPQWRGRGGRSFGPRNSTPDYVKNPSSWTRYSMKDTKVTSDRENKQIGLELFDELRSRKIELEPEGGGGEEEEGEEEEEEEEEVKEKEKEGEEDSCPKIVFKKPTVQSESEITLKDKCESEVDTSVTSADEIFGGTKKFRMNEYQVGQSKQKLKAKVTKNLEEGERKGKKDAVSLDYLTYEEDDEDD